jgi:hypothetical protein
MSALELFFPGLTRISPAIQRYTGIDLDAVVPLLCLGGLLIFIYKRGYQDVSSWVRNNLSQSRPREVISTRLLTNQQLRPSIFQFKARFTICSSPGC